MASETPEWLNKEFIKKTLEYNEEYSVAVEDLKVDKPIAKGDNFMCDIFRASIEYRRSNDSENLKILSLIIKSMIKGPLHREIAKLGVVQKEINIYKDFLPRFKSVFGENCEYDIFPESYHSSDDEILVLEDLQFKGFFTAERKNQLDYDHCVVALKALAKFHAGSVLIYDKEPALVENLGKEIMLSEAVKENNELMIKPQFLSIAVHCNATPDLQKYSKWFREFSEKAWDALVESVKRKDGELNVLNHGDYWLTNMLFKYDENGKPLKIKLIDFQLSRFTSPAVDIIYFMYSSVQEDVKDQHYNEFISIYVKELNRQLNRNGSSKRINESDLKKSIADRSYFGLYMTISLLVIVLYDSKAVDYPDFKDLSLEEIKKLTPENNPFAKLFQNEKYIQVLSKRLIEFEKNGFIKI